MIATRSDYDRAVEAGFAPDFPRERIPSLQYEEVESLIAALDEVVHRWQIAERENGARGPS
jgi:hypothetical protein